MADPKVIPAGQGVGLRLRRGEQVRIIDPNGGQSGDLVAFSDDGTQRCHGTARLRGALMNAQRESVRHCRVPSIATPHTKENDSVPAGA